MENFIVRIAFLLAALFFVLQTSSAQNPPPEAELRFDEAQSEEIADRPAAADPVAADQGRFAYKLNRKRVDGPGAIDAVTLWNVKRVRVKNRTMRFTDSTRREKGKMLKFFIERDRKKGARPHLLGNVAGYSWTSSVPDSLSANGWRDAPAHIWRYTLREEYDAARKVAGDEVLFKVPDELWRKLDERTLYVLDGVPVPGAVFQFIDGLFLRTLTVVEDKQSIFGNADAVVIGDTFPGRRPLVVLNGARTTVDTWLKFCQSGVFKMDSELPMYYFYMLPVEAVQTYGKEGKFGAICIEATH